MSALSDRLSTGIAELGLSIPQSTQNNLLAFLEFLQKWNKAYNLTAIDDLTAMVSAHLLDSLSIAPYLQGELILDIGSGAGFPGIPLAFAYPEKKFVLLDSVGKKTRFLLQAVSTFKILNVEVVQARMEKFNPSHCFDAIICRAVGTMADIVAKTERVLCPKGRWLMMKGEYPHEEMQALTKTAKAFDLKVPGLKAKRHVIVIEH
ncbi:16S rRNA (guanine(527)-N(7))-methyltransferase RsmG [Candidiatus Paracoxiella cheracis]|uniref:16S rRNA (guanine(527)-N(7))-methyltransferase RsmG n=1 Tax=Candidiatus Paracoxiella cheracis TaxID=3405120 RepID=UPI003BF45EBD